jgi:hypothetical protein
MNFPSFYLLIVVEYACTVSRNDILIPVEGLLAVTLERSVSFIITIHIDKAIAL